jgi:methionyl-tRNA formyltransferase
MRKNLIYFGSPEFSAAILQSILDSGIVNLVGVVTTPDKPQGRRLTLTPSPVALLAEKHLLPTFKPDKLDDAHLAHLKLLKPDIFLVVSYGKIIPQSYLKAPTIGTFNTHFSLLPKYRGALCISEAIKNQDQTTGVTLMKMDELLDHGPLIAQSTVIIETDDDNVTLTTKLTQSAITLLADRLPEICAQNFTITPQDESQVVFTPSHKTLSRQSAYIPYENLLHGNAKTHALVRSLNPSPGAWTTINGLEIKLLKTSLIGNKMTIDTVQLPGKSPISWKQFLQGHPTPN